MFTWEICWLLPGSSSSWRRCWPYLGAVADMTVVQALLLALSIVTFIYLGVALFKAEWF